MTLPSFAVVGRPNKGKSSIVATLARDDSVHIDSKAGSTREARRFPMQVDGETLYTLVDTPGIQRARAVLEWLQQHSEDAATRGQAVKSFVEQHEQDPQYHDECELLKPIVAGAGIIYVVDGSCPFGADYEAEMEILRWTGRPSLAVINPIESDDYVAEWTAGLGQYFRTVRIFNAHRAELTKQLELLELFGHLDTDWREPLTNAVRVLREERRAQHQTASILITDLIVDSLSYKTQQSILDGVPEAPVQKILYAQYKTHLAKRERQCRRQVEELFYYTRLKRTEQGLALEESDLFSVEDWYLWGLSKWSLVAVAASAGALVGGGTGVALDAASGGLTGGLGTLISGAGGAATGGMGAWLYADDIGQLKVKGIATGGKLIIYGPSKNINFPFVLLGRALLHHRLICKRTHANRQELELNQALLAEIGDRERRQLARIFADIRGERKQVERRAQLAHAILERCLAVDNLEQH